MAHVYYNEKGNVVVNGVEIPPKPIDDLKESNESEVYQNIKPLLEVLSKLDCGDNSCRFAQNKGGMRTNGGCVCLRDIDKSVRLEIHKIWHNYLKASAISTKK